MRSRRTTRAGRAWRFAADEWEAYQGVLPAKGSGLTSYIERFYNTLRQRGSRFVREAFSFSQKLANHIGAVWYFVHHYVHHYNAQLLPA